MSAPMPNLTVAEAARRKMWVDTMVEGGMSRSAAEPFLEAILAAHDAEAVEKSELALYLSRSALWLKVPELATIAAQAGPSGSTMFDCLKTLREQFPGDYPLNRADQRRKETQ